MVADGAAKTGPEYRGRAEAGAVRGAHQDAAEAAPRRRTAPGAHEGQGSEDGPACIFT